MTPAGVGPSAITIPFRALVGASVKCKDTSSPTPHQAMRLHSGQRHSGVSSTSTHAHYTPAPPGLAPGDTRRLLH